MKSRTAGGCPLQTKHHPNLEEAQPPPNLAFTGGHPLFVNGSVELWPGTTVVMLEYIFDVEHADKLAS